MAWQREEGESKSKQGPRGPLGECGGGVGRGKGGLCRGGGSEEQSYGSRAPGEWRKEREQVHE